MSIGQQFPDLQQCCKTLSDACDTNKAGSLSALRSAVQTASDKSLRFLGQLNNQPAVDWKERKEALHTLCQSLDTAYDCVESKKFILVRIWQWVFVPENEKSLRKARSLAHKQEAHAEKNWYSLWGMAEPLHIKKAESTLSTLNMRLKMSAFRVVGATKLKGRSVEGANPFHAIKAAHEDLQSFKKEYEHLLPKEDLASLDRAARQMQELEHWGLKVDVAAHPSVELILLSLIPFVSSSTPDERLKNLSGLVKKRIAELQPGETVLLPGGYANPTGSGHAVMYQITKERDGSYSWTIVNTGQGIGAYHQLLDVLKDSYATFRAIWNRSAGTTQQVSDYKFGKLRLEQVSDEHFLHALFTQQTIGDHSIKSMYDVLMNQLQQEGNTFTTVRPHYIQVNGTCTFDCVKSTLESELTPLAWGCLNVYSTQKGLRELEQLKKTPGQARPGQAGILYDHIVSDLSSLSAKTEGGQEFTGMALVEKVDEIGRRTLAIRREAAVEQIRSRLPRSPADPGRQQRTRKIEKLQSRIQDPKTYVEGIEKKVARTRIDDPGMLSKLFSTEAATQFQAYQKRVEKLEAVRKSLQDGTFQENVRTRLASLQALDSQNQAVRDQQLQLERLLQTVNQF